jgi:DNA-binding response OmpR family regulator
VSGGTSTSSSLALAAARRRVLIIEDEPDLVRGLRDALEFEGFDIVSSGLGREGIELARERAPDLVLLDLMLPDKIRGLEVGADDYVTKPFSVGELVARIGAIFRRMQRGGGTGGPPDEIHIGAAIVYPKRHELVRKGKTHTLSFYEVELVRLLHERAGEPVSRDELLEKIWGVSGHASTRSVDNFIVKLRKKIEESAAEPEHIVTIYGTGYKLLP